MYRPLWRFAGLCQRRAGVRDVPAGKYLSVVVAVFVDLKALERPLPKPTDELYVEARLLEALLEARLALEFLERGLVRNAAGKAFQAWKALLAALLRLEREKVMQIAKTEEERKWIAEKAKGVPTSRMKAISQMLEGLGYGGLSLATAVALDLLDYQYHGPDPDAELSKYRKPEEAAYDVKTVARELVSRVEGLRGRVRWGKELEDALRNLQVTRLARASTPNAERT